MMSACNLISSKTGELKAEKAALEFFNFLSNGEYGQAAVMFAGDESLLESMNPSIDQGNRAALWRKACTVNGFQCLPVKSVLDVEKFSLNEFLLQVEFQNPDGSLFILGPCCGASEAVMPSVSQFDVYVIEREGEYLVTSLPMLVP